MKPAIACVLTMIMLLRATLQSSPMRCAALNPFIGILQSKGVNILSLPARDSGSIAGKCSSEWYAKGTCCGYQSLVQYAVNDRKSIGQFAESINDSMNAMRNLFNRIKEISIAAGQLAVVMNNRKLQPIKEFIAYISSSESSHHELWVSRFGDILHTLNDGGACTSKINEIRAGSLCSICSPKSSGWFFGGRAVVSQETCQRVLRPCKKQLDFLSKYFQGVGGFIVKLYNSRLHQVEIGKSSQQLKDSSVMIKKLIDTLSQAKLVSLVSDYVANPSVQNTANICYSFISLAGPSFSEELSLIFLAAKHFMSMWYSHAEYLVISQPNMSHWAILTSSSPTQSISEFEAMVRSIKLPGDVICDKDDRIRIKDGMYSSSQDTAETHSGKNEKFVVLPDFKMD